MKMERIIITVLSAIFICIAIVGIANKLSDGSGSTTSAEQLQIEAKKAGEESLAEEAKKAEEERVEEEARKAEEARIEEARIEEENRVEAERLEQERVEKEREAETQRKEAERIEAARVEADRAAEEKRQQEIAANNNFYLEDGKANHDTSTGYDSPTSDPNEPTITSSTGYVAAGNNYMHKTPDCKFIRGNATNTVDANSWSGAVCNCWHY